MDRITKDKLIRKFLYFKICRNTGKSQIDMVTGLITTIVGIATFLKVFGWEKYWYLIVLFGVGRELFDAYLGHLYIKKGIASQETSLNNSLNPEFMDIYGRTKDIHKKTEEE